MQKCSLLGGESVFVVCVWFLFVGLGFFGFCLLVVFGGVWWVCFGFFPLSAGLILITVVSVKECKN